MSETGNAVATPAIATAAELDQRRADRAAPRLEQHLTIGGTVETAVHREVDHDNERRIAELAERLRRAHDDALTEHSLANVRGQAADAFARER